MRQAADEAGLELNRLLDSQHRFGMAGIFQPLPALSVLQASTEQDELSQRLARPGLGEGRTTYLIL